MRISFRLITPFYLIPTWTPVISIFWAVIRYQSCAFWGPFQVFWSLLISTADIFTRNGNFCPIVWFHFFVLLPHEHFSAIWAPVLSPNWAETIITKVKNSNEVFRVHGPRRVCVRCLSSTSIVLFPEEWVWTFATTRTVRFTGLSPSPRIFIWGFLSSSTGSLLILSYLF